MSPTPPYPSAIPVYNRLQQVFCLNWLSNCAGSKSGSDHSLTTFASSCVNSVLNDQATINLIGTWQVVWGPDVVTAKTGPFRHVAANTMFVAKQAGEDGGTTYVIAIAGTNPVSIYGWLGEDFDVVKTLQWTQALQLNFNSPPALVYTDPTVPLISAGTANGLSALLVEMKDKANTKQQLLPWLTAEIAGNTGSPIEVVVSGHSLGGALSASLALLLADTQGSASGWDPNYRAVVSALPSAGAPPGNVAFAKHYDAVLGTRTNRLWNSLDVIPHAWEIDLLIQAPHLYFPYLAPNAAVRTLVDLVLADVSASKQTYLQINRQTPPLPGQVDIAATVGGVSLTQLVTDEIATLVVGRIAKHFGWNDAEKSAVLKVVIAFLGAVETFAANRNQLPAPPALTGDLATDKASVVGWLKDLGDDALEDIASIVSWLAKELNVAASTINSFLQQVYQEASAEFTAILKAIAGEWDQFWTLLIAIAGKALAVIDQVAKRLNVPISAVVQQLPGVLAFLEQLAIQHVPAYGQLLGVTEFTALQKSIREATPYPVPGN